MELSGKKKPAKRLGRGLNALIPGGAPEEEEVKSDKLESETVVSDTVISESVKTDHEKESAVTGKDVEVGERVISDKVKSDSVTSGDVATKFAEDVVERALIEGEKNPRVVIWSPKASIAMRILKKTIPEFSISKVTSEILEEGIRERFPEVWEVVEQKLEERKRV